MDRGGEVEGREGFSRARFIGFLYYFVVIFEEEEEDDTRLVHRLAIYIYICITPPWYFEGR